MFFKKWFKRSPWLGLISSGEERREDQGDVMFLFNTSEKLLVLNWLEAGEWLLASSREEGVTVVQSRED